MDFGERQRERVEFGRLERGIKKERKKEKKKEINK